MEEKESVEIYERYMEERYVRRQPIGLLKSYVGILPLRWSSDVLGILCMSRYAHTRDQQKPMTKFLFRYRRNSRQNGKSHELNIYVIASQF